MAEALSRPSPADSWFLSHRGTRCNPLRRSCLTLRLAAPRPSSWGGRYWDDAPLVPFASCDESSREPLAPRADPGVLLPAQQPGSELGPSRWRWPPGSVEAAGLDRWRVGGCALRATARWIAGWRSNRARTAYWRIRRLRRPAGATGPLSSRLSRIAVEAWTAHEFMALLVAPSQPPEPDLLVQLEQIEDPIF
jgi:hypothetical protein